MRMQPREDSSFVFDRPVTHDHPSYIERKDELESLNSAVERGKLVFLQGAIGSGKTSLLYEFERQQLAHGGRTACVIRIDCDRGHDQLRINASARSSLIAGSVATVDGFWRLTLRSLSHGVWMFLSRLEQRDREISGPIPEHLLNRYENSKRLAKQISESIREIEKGKELSDGLKELASVIRYFPYPIILVFDDIDVIVHPKGIWRRDLNLLLSDLSSLYVSSTVVPGSDPRIRYVFCSFVPLSELIGRIWPEPQRPEDSRTEKRPKSLLSKRRDVEYWESSMSEFEAGALPDGTREFLNLPSETVFVGSFDVEQIADSLLGSRKHSLPSFVARWIWQESGGIPLLAQVLCHHVLRQWDERMGWFDLMNLVRDTQPVQGLVNRLYRSLTEPQLMLLRIAHGTANRRLQEMVRQAERKIGRLPKSVYTSSLSERESGSPLH